MTRSCAPLSFAQAVFSLCFFCLYEDKQKIIINVLFLLYCEAQRVVCAYKNRCFCTCVYRARLWSHMMSWAGLTLHNSHCSIRLCHWRRSVLMKSHMEPLALIQEEMQSSFASTSISACLCCCLPLWWDVGSHYSSACLCWSSFSLLFYSQSFSEHLTKQFCLKDH